MYLSHGRGLPVGSVQCVLAGSSPVSFGFVEALKPVQER